MRILLCGLLLLTASNAEAAPTRQAASPAPKIVKIARPARRVVIPPRALGLKSIRALGGKKGVVHKGLKDYRSVRLRVRELRGKLGDRMQVTPLVKTGSFVLDRIDLRGPAKPGAAGQAPKPKILIVGGVHGGSEPVGVEASLRFAESLVKDARLLDAFDITVVPLVNPGGLMRTDITKSKSGTPGRYTTEGVDLNRSFAKGKWTPESKAMAALMTKERFHAVLDLHGAGSHRDGFFAIRGGDDGGIAERMMGDAGGIPLLTAKSAGATYKFNAPGVVTSGNEGTLKHFAISTGARYSYTFEAPARFSAEAQVQGQVSMLRSALRNIAAHGQR